ncbi:hypothetical protein Ciccas_009529 [Cichlidogyrus casuarinus]|uniref:Uncharacterized protein n=1 Tax=Cichlidogyrus casuarinus TaxID=1844966 RepID=A0ABD2Q195_9PLAT
MLCKFWTAKDRSIGHNSHLHLSKPGVNKTAFNTSLRRRTILNRTARQNVDRGPNVVYYVTVQGIVHKRHENQLRTRLSKGQEEGFQTLFDLCDHPSKQTTPQLNPSVGPSEAVQLQTHEPAVEPPPIVPDVMTRPRRICRYPKKLDDFLDKGRDVVY